MELADFDRGELAARIEQARQTASGSAGGMAAYLHAGV
jgi:hypothetical protein